MPTFESDVAAAAEISRRDNSIIRPTKKAGVVGGHRVNNHAGRLDLNTPAMISEGIDQRDRKPRLV